MEPQRFDMTSPAFKADPFPTLDRMREAGSLVWSKIPIIGHVWLATTHEAVTDVLHDHERFVRDARNAGKSKWVDLQWWVSKVFRGPAQNMLAKDEPDHRRLRDLVEDAFRRRSVEDMRERVETLARTVMDQTIEVPGQSQMGPGDAGVVDFTAFARQFPLAVICELLGLPAEDRAKFTRWAAGLATVSSLVGLFKLLPFMFKISGYFRDQIRQCRTTPRDGLLSLLVQAERDGDSLSEDELVSMGFLLLFAGHETTTHLITMALLCLLDHPDQRALLVSDWSLAVPTVDEVLRYATPIQFTKPRIVAEDMTLHGQSLKRGQYVLPMLACANSDPQVFDDPQRFDIKRSPNRHVGFGSGIHICLGMKLARMEAAVALEHVLTRFPGLSLAVPRDGLIWTKRIGTRSLLAMPLRLTG